MPLESLSSSSSSLVPQNSAASGGNLLSSVAPPSALPSFVLPPTECVTQVATSSTHHPIAVTQPLPASAHAFHPTTFRYRSGFLDIWGEIFQELINREKY